MNVILLALPGLVAAAPPQIPDFSLEIRDDYSLPMITKKLGIEFYVRTSYEFNQKYPLESEERAKVEDTIVDEYIQKGIEYCEYELKQSIPLCFQSRYSTLLPLSLCFQSRKNQERVKSIFLLAIPDEYLLKFHNVPDAKSLSAAIKSRFRGNEESKKMQKNVLKHQFENFVTASNKTLDKAYDRFQKLISQLEIHGAYVSKEDINQKFLRSLPPSWSQIALIMRNKPDIDEIDIDDLYNNLRVYEDEMKKSSTSSSNTQNLAFLSSENTNSTNEVSTVSGDFGVSAAGGINQVPTTPCAHDIAYSFLAQPTTSPQLENEDFQQMDGDDLEELDLRWQVAMLTVRVKKFIQRTGRNMDFKEKRHVSLDKSKIECYNCHRKGHFARECRSGRSQGRRSYGDNGRSNAQTAESSSQALVAQDGLGGYDWSNDFEVELVNYALMVISSSNSSSSSNSEVQKCSKNVLNHLNVFKRTMILSGEKHNKAKLKIRGYEIALESLESRILGHEKNELAWGEKYEFQNYDLKCREIKINNLNLEVEKVVKEKDELKNKIAKWEDSTKNLDEILNSQMSARDKSGLGYSTQLNELSSNHETDSENSFSVFDGRTSDEESTPTNDTSSKEDGYKAVPPPIIGNFLTPRADISFPGLDEYTIRNKIIESQTSELNTKTSETSGQTNAANTVKPKSASESVKANPKINRDRVIIEDWTSDDEEEVSEVQTVRPETQTVKTRDDKSGQNSKKQGIDLEDEATPSGEQSSPPFENFVTASNETLDKAYDRFQKLISQLEIHGAYVSKEDINQKFLRSLPPSWSQIALIMRNKPDIDEIDIDDLYTPEVSTVSGDFRVSATDGINQVPTTPCAHDIAYSFLAQPTTSPQLENEDFSQMSKIECYNCHRKGHFARECRSGRNQGRDLFVTMAGANTLSTQIIIYCKNKLGLLRNQERVKSILLLAIPDEYLLKFHNVPDAKSLWAAIKSRFGDIDEIDIDDLYNNLRVYEDEMKKSSTSSSNTQNLAFLSSKNTNIPTTPCAHDIAYSFLAQPTTSPQLENEDFQQMDGDDLEELDLRWQVAMLTVRGILLENVDLEEIKEEDLLVTMAGAMPPQYDLHHRHWWSDRSSDERRPTTTNVYVSNREGLDEYAIRNKIIESQTSELNTKTSETSGQTNAANTVKPKSASESVKANPKINRDRVIIEDWTSYDEEEASEGNPKIVLQGYAVVVVVALRLHMGTSNKVYLSDYDINAMGSSLAGSAQPAEPHHTPVDPSPPHPSPPHPSPPHPSPPHPSPLHHSPPYSPPYSPPHYSPPRSYEAPKLMDIIPRLVTRIETLETELQQTKTTYGKEFSLWLTEGLGEGYSGDIDVDLSCFFAKTLSKVASQGVSKGKIIKYDKGQEIYVSGQDVNTGSTKVDSGTASKRGQKKRKAQVFCKKKWLDYWVNQRKKHFAEERAKAKRNKPMTQSQLRIYMSNYLKNQGTWKLSQLKKLKFEEIKEEFDKLVQQIDTFVPMNFKATKEKIKKIWRRASGKNFKETKD
ncbi:putative ribonuclease H-like domain-containing protein [Tanacetum coccineum]